MMDTRRPITLRQREVLEYIRLFSETRGFMPTVREIGLGVGLSSTSTIQNHLCVLERKGYILRDHLLSRTIRLLEEKDWIAMQAELVTA